MAIGIWRVHGPPQVLDRCAQWLSGFDPKDATSLDLPVPQWSAGLNASMAGKRVGIPREYRVDNMPYGGVKDSGLGREGGHHGIEEYLDLRYVSWRVG